jgi:hypothetical protein
MPVRKAAQTAKLQGVSMHSLRWEIMSACVAAALFVGVSVAPSPAAAPGGADQTAVALPIRPGFIEGNKPAAQYTPSDLRPGFPELPRKPASTPCAKTRDEHALCRYGLACISRVSRMCISS